MRVMARKASQPALYELMRNRRERSKAPQDARAQPPPADEPDVPHAPEQPPRRPRRLPVGYLWAGGGAAAAIAVLAFSFVFRLGERSNETEQDRQWLALYGPSLPVPDPELPVVQAPTGIGQKGIDSVLPPGYGPIASDPRSAGLNYFVLAYTPRDNALKLARFFRDHGVEAYALKAKNASLYRVIAAPGYAKGERGSEAVRALEARIADAARKWKLEINSKDDLAYYPERYDGPEK